ncbi:MAG TPA: pyrroloquinoline quinone biosynthesis peptide chaperone PqqD [Methylophilaceae bacterium]|jgi:pyrroloquinoline quinone biosynthesis protein D|nr:pyrroloquinoline quinone biosynthesis peptide chaperone PqqD [Methylophilaceae bacterium]HCC73065.1 pyrroloquinoline quinone biosynthesis peptide chaperone PqqD [Methylophilaceae bacterium]
MTIAHQDIFKIAAHHRFQWEEAQQSHVILFPEGMVKLNGSAGEVLGLVDGKNSVNQIVTSLKEKFQGVEGIEKDILSMIQFALDKAWIERVN